MHQEERPAVAKALKWEKHKDFNQRAERSLPVAGEEGIPPTLDWEVGRGRETGPLG